MYVCIYVCMYVCIYVFFSLTRSFINTFDMHTLYVCDDVCIICVFTISMWTVTSTYIHTVSSHILHPIYTKERVPIFPTYLPTYRLSTPPLSIVIFLLKPCPPHPLPPFSPPPGSPWGATPASCPSEPLPVPPATPPPPPCMYVNVFVCVGRYVCM